MKLSGSDLTALRVFDAVARNQGFAPAQVELGLSQPAISNHIAALEQRFGVRLCNRGRSGFSLTEKGRFVLESTRSLFTALDEFSGAMDDLREQIVGTLRIGIVDAISTDVRMRLPDAVEGGLAYFERRVPNWTGSVSDDWPAWLDE